MMNNSGMGYYQQGNYAMARHEFAVAVAEAPWNPDYRHNLALSMKRMGDVAGAERVLRHNLTINAMHQPTYHSLAHLLNEQGRQGEAYELVQTWSESQPYMAAAHIEMAWLQREMGNLPEAERELRHALQIEPYNPTALAHLGQIYQDAGQTTQAATLYQRSLAVHWDQPQVQTRLASIVPDALPGLGGPQMARYSPMLPPPAFDGAMMASGPQPTIMAGNQPISMDAISSLPMSSTPMETIMIPPATMTGESTSTMTAGPQLAAPTATISAPQPAPSTGWQPVPQSGAAPSVKSTATLPTVEAH
jgi:Tfp pilus assembly protein PilF